MKTWKEQGMKKKDMNFLWNRAVKLFEESKNMYPSRIRHIGNVPETSLEYPEIVKEMITELERLTATQYSNFSGKYFRLCPHAFCN